MPGRIDSAAPLGSTRIDIHAATNDYLEHGAPHPPLDDDPPPLSVAPQALRMPNIVDAHDRRPEQYVDLTAEPSGDALDDLHTLAAYRAARVNPQEPDDELDDQPQPTRPRAPRRRASSGRRRVSLMDDDMHDIDDIDDDYELVDADGLPTAVRGGLRLIMLL